MVFEKGCKYEGEKETGKREFFHCIVEKIAFLKKGGMEKLSGEYTVYTRGSGQKYTPVRI